MKPENISKENNTSNGILADVIRRVLWMGGNDDLTAIHDNYTLRVEQMDKNKWWWCVYFNDERIADDESLAKTKKQAKMKAIWAMKRHIGKHAV